MKDLHVVGGRAGKHWREGLIYKGGGGGSEKWQDRTGICLVDRYLIEGHPVSQSSSLFLKEGISLLM